MHVTGPDEVSENYEEPKISEILVLKKCLETWLWACVYKHACLRACMCKCTTMHVYKHACVLE